MGDGAVHPDAQGYILSAVSDDARRWRKEPGVRVDVDIHERGSLRVVCPDVVQLADGLAGAGKGERPEPGPERPRPATQAPPPPCLA